MNRPLDVLHVCKWDWANTGYRFVKCMEMVGLNVIALKGIKHKYDYPDQTAVTPQLGGKVYSRHPITIKAPELKPLAESAKVIHFHASTFVDMGVDLTKKKVVVQHGGSTYRKAPDDCDKVFNEFANVTIMQFPMYMVHNPVNPVLVYYPVDTDRLQPDFTRKGKLRIGHFPSTGIAKGTEHIEEVCCSLSKLPDYKDRFEYTIDTNNLPWDRHMERMNQYDIIIETVKDVYHGQKFGEWGNTALEAAALGKIVVTNCHSSELYRREYGDCALQIANDRPQLMDTLKRLLYLTDKEIGALRHESRQWAEDKHGMKPTADRLWMKVYRNLL